MGAIKHQGRRRKIRSRAASIRLHEEEWSALQQFAATLGEPPSRILRRLLREALTGGPDYFKDELADVARMSRELARIGRNLNQLAKAANQGGTGGGADVRRVINAGLVQMEAVKGLYLRAVTVAVKREVRPLYEEAGLI